MSVISRIGQASIHISATPSDLGKMAASHVAKEIRSRLLRQPHVRMIFAAAPSQTELLHALIHKEDVDWSRVEAFHMDEYIGLKRGSPQLFSEWLKREFFSHVNLYKTHLIDATTSSSLLAEAYSELLAEAPVDIVCLGIGMNGHIAFNDPPANFNEPKDVLVVELDESSRSQQVEEGLFQMLEDVPTHAITLSIPRLLRAEKLFCCVSGKLKQDAVTRAFLGPIDASCPASILRQHSDCVIYLDEDAASGLLEEGQ